MSRNKKAAKFKDLPAAIDIKARSKDRPRPAQAHLFAKAGQVDDLARWLEAGGAVDVTDAEGNTPLMYAVWERQLETERFLLGHGADARHRNRGGRGVLHNLARRFSRGERSEEEMLLLLAHGAEPLATDKDGEDAFGAELERQWCGKRVASMHLVHLYLHLFDNCDEGVPSIPRFFNDESNEAREAVRIIRTTLTQRQRDTLAAAPARRVARKRA